MTDHKIGTLLQKEVVSMTMPTTASKVKEFGGIRPEDMSNEQLEVLRLCLDEDLPGAFDFIEEAARYGVAAHGFAHLARSPKDVGNKEEWNTLVSRLARLFASSFGQIPREWTSRHYGLDIAFVNCCIVATEPGRIDPAKLWSLQTNSQLTPDC